MSERSQDRREAGSETTDPWGPRSHPTGGTRTFFHGLRLLWIGRKRNRCPWARELAACLFVLQQSPLNLGKYVTE